MLESVAGLAVGVDDFLLDAGRRYGKRRAAWTAVKWVLVGQGSVVVA